MFRTVINILVIALDILVVALASQEGDIEMDNKAKIYRVHYKNGASKLVAAKSGQGLTQGITGIYEQRVSPKRG